jgi:hypothetical protein
MNGATHRLLIPTALSPRQHYLTPLNLIAAETGRGVAMWADDGRPASDRNPEVRAIEGSTDF